MGSDSPAVLLSTKHHRCKNHRRGSSTTHSQVVNVVLSRFVKLPVWHLQVARETGVLEDKKKMTFTFTQYDFEELVLSLSTFISYYFILLPHYFYLSDIFSVGILLHLTILIFQYCYFYFDWLDLKKMNRFFWAAETSCETTSIYNHL